MTKLSIKKYQANIEKIDLYKNGKERKIFIKMGENFQKSQEKIIFFFHDAQNFFQKEEATIKISWNLPQILEKLGIKNYLAFGLACLPWYERMVEYSPFELRDELKNDNNFKKLKSIKPGGKKYLNGIFKNLIPTIEKKYKINLIDHKLIMIGSSMGGLITTYCAQKYPAIFDGYISFSNCFYSNYPESFHYFSKKNQLQNYYYYMGGKEDSGNISNQNEYIETYKFMHKLLKKNKNCKGNFNSAGVHSEKAWQRELPKAIKYVLKNL